MRKVCFILLLYLSLYDFYSVKIQPRACSMPLSWTVVEYHSQSHWARSNRTQSPKVALFSPVVGHHELIVHFYSVVKFFLV